jgi:hypothetical protein
MSWPLNFRSTDSEVQVRVGRWVVRRVALSDIRDAGLSSGLRVPLWNEHWCNVWPFRYVVIRRRSGWIPTFIINPPEPDAFLANLRHRAGLPPGGSP